MPGNLCYEQSTGRLFEADKEGKPSKRLAIGYSGFPPFTNDPQSQWLVARGPIPRGKYRVSRAFDHTRLGPVVFHLEPFNENQMSGRSGFFIHGDNELANRTASHGCLIFGRSVREALRSFAGGTLYVI